MSSCKPYISLSCILICSCMHFLVFHYFIIFVSRHISPHSFFFQLFSNETCHKKKDFIKQFNLQISYFELKSRNVFPISYHFSFLLNVARTWQLFYFIAIYKNKWSTFLKLLKKLGHKNGDLFFN